MDGPGIIAGLHKTTTRTRKHGPIPVSGGTGRYGTISDTAKSPDNPGADLTKAR